MAISVAPSRPGSPRLTIAPASEEPASPIYDPAARYAVREGMELALLAAIQTLPGRQRAILILRDVLGWTGPEVAELLDSTVAAVNSALQRARATIDSELPPASPSPAAATERDLLLRYVDAWERVDIDGLVALLREDAAMRMPPLPTVWGAAAIGDFFRELCGGGDISQIRVAPTRANGRPAVVMRRLEGDAWVPHGILVLEIDGEEIGGLDTFLDPSLVAAFEATLLSPRAGNQRRSGLEDELGELHALAAASTAQGVLDVVATRLLGGLARAALVGPERLRDRPGGPAGPIRQAGGCSRGASGSSRSGSSCSSAALRSVRSRPRSSS